MAVRVSKRLRIKSFHVLQRKAEKSIKIQNARTLIAIALLIKPLGNLFGDEICCRRRGLQKLPINSGGRDTGRK